MTKNTLIKFNKSHIGVAIKWQIEVIAALANLDSPPPEIDKLSVVLSVLWRCYENAPDLIEGTVK